MQKLSVHIVVPPNTIARVAIELRPLVKAEPRECIDVPGEEAHPSTLPPKKTVAA